MPNAEASSNDPEYRFRGKYPHDGEGVVIYDSRLNYSPERVIELICLGNEEIDFSTFPPEMLLELMVYIEQSYLDNENNRQLLSHQRHLITSEFLTYGEILKSVVVAIQKALPERYRNMTTRP